MRRFGQVIGIDPSGVERYRSFHQKIWPEIESAIRAAGIRNYSIFIDGDQLFGYFEYHAPDDEFQARMKCLAEAPRMREWWDIMEPLQKPRDGRPPDEWWLTLEEVFHQD
ncbi:MAG: L-rhamnose mutarotase [Planctomycetota bacterium]|jgi:L-rhamnose mutarotase|nr:L-rhamnose mutarotase [Planctomycetota bacterium]